MRKIVINACYGGFSLSKEAYEYLALPWDGYGHFKGPRDDVKLIECVETLGSKASSGTVAKLKIVEIPDDVKWQIEEYDGYEHVAEVHRIWD